MATWNKFENFARTTLGEALDAGETALDVSSTAGFPATFPFYATIWDASAYPDPTNDTAGREIVQVTANPSGTTYTITRGQGGTSDIAHDSGEAFANCLTAEDLEQIQTEVSAITTDLHALEATIGGEANYTTWDTAGHQEMAGTAKPWDDLRIEPVARATGSNAPAFEQYFTDGSGSRGVYLYSFTDAPAGSEKEVHFTMQLPHDWDQSTIHVHVHWVGAVSDTTATPRWGLEYTMVEPNGTFGNSGIIYAAGNVGDDPDITAGKHYITEFADITPTSAQDGLSTILIGRLFRDSADGADTYNAGSNKCGLLYIDAHYQRNSLGSDDEYVK